MPKYRNVDRNYPENRLPPQVLRRFEQLHIETSKNGPLEPRAADRERQRVLKLQQERLVILRHASRCTYPEGSCPATHNCAQYKKLWIHISSCRAQQCDRPHCVSSRYVLSHYHRCQEDSCAVCGPVREAIDRHNKLKLQQQQERSHVDRNLHNQAGSAGRRAINGSNEETPTNFYL